MDKTLNDLLEVAIDHEISSQNMYQAAYNIVSDSQAKLFLRELIDEEKGHQTMLESIKEMEIYDGSIILDDASIIESGKSSHKTDDDISTENTIDDILNIALKREYRAKSIFEKMASTTMNDELKGIFMKLAEEEDIHHKNISKKFNMQKGELGYEM